MTSQEQGVVAPTHRPHPSESEIVREALEGHADRLRDEFQRARPSVVVTLGNAALRVLATLVDGDDLPKKLSFVEHLYARPIQARLAGLAFEWLPLAHPASPAPYQHVHQAWVASRAAR